MQLMFATLKIILLQKRKEAKKEIYDEDEEERVVCIL